MRKLKCLSAALAVFLCLSLALNFYLYQKRQALQERIAALQSQKDKNSPKKTNNRQKKKGKEKSGKKTNPSSKKIDPSVPRIVFRSSRSGPFELYSISIKGTDLIKLTNNQGRIEHVDLSADGKLAITAIEGSIYIINTDGTKSRRVGVANLPKQLNHPKFSPDGKEIFFMYSLRGWKIFRVGLKGGESREITIGHSNTCRLAASRDGKKIVFLSYNRSWRLIGLNPSKPKLRVLATNVSSSHSPRFTSDGKRILYVKWVNSRSEIYSVSFATGDNKRLFEGSSPDIAPDGRIVFVRGHDIIVFDGKKKTKLGFGTFPHWLLKGKYILYHEREGSNWEIYIMKDDGSQKVNLSNHQGQDFFGDFDTGP